MRTDASEGWPALLRGFPWFAGENRFPLPAYSEFMPPPRLGLSPFGEIDEALFFADDPFGWNVSEIEEEYELKPGLEHLAQLIVGALAGLGRGAAEPRLAGHAGRNLAGNPYWPPELAALAGKLGHERYVVLLPLALSRTQDDKGRIRWTLFGSSEQGPERAFWRSFLSAPGRETAERDALGFFSALLSRVYGERSREPSSLHGLGFRLLPSVPDPLFPTWTEDPLPSWTRPFLIDDSASFEDVRYLLTFRPFGELPGEARRQYASGRLALLPFPGSLVFWCQEDYLRLLKDLPLAAQIPLQRLAPRFESPGRLRVPQSGWLHEPGSEGRTAEIHPDLLVNTYRRTSRWDRVLRSVEEASGTLGDKVARVLFSTAPDDMGLYGKPMARNCQIWTEDARLILDGPRATRAQIAAAGAEISRGGLFRYRFLFPAMRVGRREVYWQRPLAAYWAEKEGRAELLDKAPLGCLTAYDADAPDPAAAEFLWPRLSRRGAYLAALGKFDRAPEHFAHQTALNIVSLLDAYGWRRDQPLPRSFARSLLRLPENETLEEWLAALPDKADDRGTGEWVREELEKRLAPPAATAPAGARPGPASSAAPAPGLTFVATATRAFEEAFWRDIFFLSHGKFVNTDNADCYQDPKTLSELAHRHRDLEALGDYLLGRHAQAIADAGLEGKAVCGEIPFRWETDFPYDFYGGWKNDQDGHGYERDLLVIIPGKNRQEAIVLADHYDTAYMEDRYDRKRGGSLLRIASSGADDNHSATAALLQAAPVFLRLAKERRLERDVWLLHLTGEEFPADSLGARQFARALIEGTLRMRAAGGERKGLDLSGVRLRGLFVMDMIAHNRNGEKDIFQISPGRGPSAFALAELAHLANRDWNALAEEGNRGPRRGCLPGQRSRDGLRIPPLALYPRLRGEVRSSDDPQSSLYNTDGQIFSDAGLPVVLFMENYDINRQGYHDSHDTMENIDLDYGAAVAAIAIEAAARAAAAARPA